MQTTPRGSHAACKAATRTLHRFYIFRVYVKVILSISQQFSRFYFTRVIRKRTFTLPEVTIV